jgi:ssDNA-binding Zn-finger/Zn-ribbon topoisomerase 1
VADHQCPQCHVGSLAERTNKKTGQIFYGCDRYPTCKFAVASLDRLAPKPGPVPNDELVAAVRELTAAVRALAQRATPGAGSSEAATTL